MLSYYVAFLVAVYHTYRVCFATITAYIITQVRILYVAYYYIDLE